MKRSLAIALVAGGLDLDICILNEVPRLDGNAAAYNEALGVLASFHEMQQRYAEIVRDGRIDEADADGVLKFDQAYHAATKRSAAIHRAVMDKFNASLQRNHRANGGA